MASSIVKYPALVKSRWLADALKTSRTPAGKPVRVVNCTMGVGVDNQAVHDKRHIPGSRHIGLNHLRDTTSPYNITIPPANVFADIVGKTHGIGNDAHVIIYEDNPVFRVARMWWMFRYFGHDAVSVLDGGLPGWLAEGHPVSDQAEPDPEPATFTVTKTRDDLYKSYEDIVANLKEPKFQIMDSRPKDWYDGTKPAPVPGMKLGILKSAIPLPFPTLLEEGTAMFRPADELKAAFESSGIDLTKPLTSSCMVGVTACILALSAFIVGKEDVSVFDGSWDEFNRKGPEDAATFYEHKPAAA